MAHLGLLKAWLRGEELFDKTDKFMDVHYEAEDYKVPQAGNMLAVGDSAVGPGHEDPSLPCPSSASAAAASVAHSSIAPVCFSQPPVSENKVDCWTGEDKLFPTSDANSLQEDTCSVTSRSSSQSPGFLSTACVSPYTPTSVSLCPSSTAPLISQGSLGTPGLSALCQEEAAEAAHAHKRDRPGSPWLEEAKKLRSDLPPCRICAGRASGFHYGVNTCEACKGFYRRTLSKLKKGELTQLTCTNQTKACEINKKMKMMCPFCRFEKCKRAGMSKEAIKTGRYTHAKRTQDTLEVQRLSKGLTEQLDDSNELVQKSDTERDSAKSVVHFALRKDTTRISGLLCSGKDEEKEMEALIAHVVRAHDQYIYTGEESYPGCIERKQEEKLAQLKEASKHPSPVTSTAQQVSAQNKPEGHSPTGNRKEIMQFHVNNSERWIRGYTTFAKEVPGFSALPTEDQQHLAKHARIEFWYLGAFAGYSSQKNVAVMPNGRCFTKDEMYSVWDRTYVDVSFRLSDILKKLDVTHEELILMKAICLTSADRDRFKMVDPDSVDRIQDRLVRCLHWRVDNRFASNKDRLQTVRSIYSAITNLRDLNHAEFKTLKDTTLYKMYFTQSEVIMSYLPY